MHGELVSVLKMVIANVMQVIQDGSAFNAGPNRAKALQDFVRSFEQIVSNFEPKRVHKLAFYLILKAQADILVEIESFDLAIRAYKTLKNWCRRW